jgi:Zn-dependent M28 family amino/carboxypeptidase
VIVELDGPGDDMVVLGAHYDTVPEVLGANDNASETAIVLSLAETLAGKSLPFGLKFIAFGSEELGLLGSRYYVESLTAVELQRTNVMLNFDAVGTGATLGILGNQEFIDLALDFGEPVGVELEVSQGVRGGSSDHASFAAAGVPVLMFFSTDISRIHTAADNTLEFIEPELLGGVVIVAEAFLQSPELAEAVAGN